MNRKYKILCNVKYIYIKLIPAESNNSVTYYRGPILTIN